MKLLSKSNSQSGQESLVLHMLQYKKYGTYLEIGAYDGVELSNTYLLENKYNWTGIALDISEEFTIRYNKKRKNRCIQSDALRTDFEKLMAEEKFPEVIDYLQLDIEPAVNTYNCLLRIPLHKYRFRVITFEHDLYAEPENLEYKNSAYDYLTKLGYIRVADNVGNSGNAYEDWYVDPSNIERNVIPNLKADVDFTEHFDS